jgi:hypothetical protein
MSGDHNEYQKTKSYLNDDFECPRCGHCCQALETEQEPVAWMYVNEDGECEQIEYGAVFDEPGVTPLYTAPPKREWVGLTDDDVSYFRYQATFCDEFDAAFMAELIEKDLKEKNHG